MNEEHRGWAGQEVSRREFGRAAGVATLAALLGKPAASSARTGGEATAVLAESDPRHPKWAPKGRLIMLGGGVFHDEYLDNLQVDNVRRPVASSDITGIPTAIQPYVGGTVVYVSCGIPKDRMYEKDINKYTELFTKLGAKNVHFIKDRAEANNEDSAALKALKSKACKMVILGGGHQDRMAETLKDTVAGKEIRECYRKDRDFNLVTNSAGTAALGKTIINGGDIESEPTVAGEMNKMELEKIQKRIEFQKGKVLGLMCPGLGLTQGIIPDTHLAGKEYDPRLERIKTVISQPKYADQIGLALTECTGVIIEHGDDGAKAKVIGFGHRGRQEDWMNAPRQLEAWDGREESGYVYRVTHRDGKVLIERGRHGAEFDLGHFAHIAPYPEQEVARNNRSR